MPSTMSTLVNNAPAYGVIAFTLLASFLFTRERIPIPITSLFVIVAFSFQLARAYPI